MIRIAIALTAFLFLAACTTPEERAIRLAEQEAADQAQCQRLGFKPGTEAFGNCMLKLVEIRAEEAQTRALRRAYFDRPIGFSRFGRYPYYW